MQTTLFGTKKCGIHNNVTIPSYQFLEIAIGIGTGIEQSSVISRQFSFRSLQSDGISLKLPVLQAVRLRVFFDFESDPDFDFDMIFLCCSSPF